MGVWSDITFNERGKKVFSPFDSKRVQPASYDMTLGNNVLIFNEINVYYDLANRMYRDILTGEELSPWKKIRFSKEKPFILKPNQFALGTTFETINVPLDVLGRFEGKSSLARVGLMVHITAGYIDPGFKGQITLEFKNISECDIEMIPGIPIGQISIHTMDQKVSRGYGEYGNHYQNQKGTTPAKK
jgi:dCTP deaminase